MTYPGTDLTQVAAVNLLCPGRRREGEVEVSGVAGEHLVTQVRLPWNLAQLKRGLDLPHVWQIRVDAVRVEDGGDHVVSLKEGARDGSVGDLAINLINTHRTEMAGGKVN